MAHTKLQNIVHKRNVIIIILKLEIFNRINYKEQLYGRKESC